MTTAQDTISSIAAKATYGGAGTAIFFGLNAYEFAAMAGVVIGVLGWIVTLVFKLLERKDRLKHHKIMESKRK